MKRFIISFAVIFAVMLSCILYAGPENNGTAPVSSVNSPKVLTVADSDLSADASKVLEARFLNMLNHNFVYNEAFQTVEGVVNNSVIALLDKRDALKEDFIAEAYIFDYVYNMYGVSDIDFSEINTDFPYEEGYVYIIPRGFSVYEHSIISVSENEDGSYTVKTKVSVDAHDSECEYSVCTSLFVKNNESQFGFNLISADIGIEASSI